MAVIKKKPNLQEVEGFTYEPNTQQNVSKGLDKYSTAYNNTQTPNVFENQYNNYVPSSQVKTDESKKVVTPTQEPLKNAYDNYKSQLDLDKLSEQNEIANANKLAQTYMDNYLKYYGMQGSGMGQSAYANLGAQQTQQMANVNRDYNIKLQDYRNQFNQGLKDEAAINLQGMTKEQQQEYINKFKGQSGVDDTTISNMEAQANAINYNRAENENANILSRGEANAVNMSDEQWANFIERQKNNPNITQDTLQTLQDYRDMYGTSTFETSQEEWTNTMANAINDAIANKDYNKLAQLRAINTKMTNAQTQEELDAAIDEMKALENYNYVEQTPETVGATSGVGSKEQPYVYSEAKLADLKDMVAKGKIPENSWVQYTNSAGVKVLRQVSNGQLTNRQQAKDTISSYAVIPSTKFQMTNRQKTIKEYGLKEGDYIVTGNKNNSDVWVVKDNNFTYVGKKRDFNFE